MNPSRRDLGSALVAALALVASARPAFGATDTVVRLDYHADEEGKCVGEDELRRMVTDQLGHDPFSPDGDQRVTITIAKTDAGFRGRIVWTEADGRQVGERNLLSRSRDCREIVANVAFAVALQLQLVERGAPNDTNGGAPTGGQSAPGPTTPPNPPPPITERPSPPTEGSRGSARPPPGRPMLAVGAGPAVGLGMTPGATAFGRLFVVARLRRLSGELAADAALPVTQHNPDGPGVDVDALGASAAGCGHVSIASACLLGRLGWIRARGFGLALPSTSWGWFGEVGLRLAASRELGRFIVSAHADGLVMLSRWNVVLNDAVVWAVPRVGGVLGLDVALRFF